eukprot:GHVS01010545.1.p1 GENE.GHVS01010545.1~~GHVS01010545.1.p1  ORF type:complete len:784 (+),score=148.49 GHVS01010545.1:182-2353(+)
MVVADNTSSGDGSTAASTCSRDPSADGRDGGAPPSDGVHTVGGQIRLFSSFGGRGDISSAQATTKAPLPIIISSSIPSPSFLLRSVYGRSFYVPSVLLSRRRLLHTATQWRGRQPIRQHQINQQPPESPAVVGHIERERIEREQIERGPTILANKKTDVLTAQCLCVRLWCQLKNLGLPSPVLEKEVIDLITNHPKRLFPHDLALCLSTTKSSSSGFCSHPSESAIAAKAADELVERLEVYGCTLARMLLACLGDGKEAHKVRKAAVNVLFASLVEPEHGYRPAHAEGVRIHNSDLSSLFSPTVVTPPSAVASTQNTLQFLRLLGRTGLEQWEATYGFCASNGNIAHAFHSFSNSLCTLTLTELCDSLTALARINVCQSTPNICASDLGIDALTIAQLLNGLFIRVALAADVATIPQVAIVLWGAAVLNRLDIPSIWPCLQTLETRLAASSDISAALDEEQSTTIQRLFIFACSLKQWGSPSLQAELPFNFPCCCSAFNLLTDPPLVARFNYAAAAQAEAEDPVSQPFYTRKNCLREALASWHPMDRSSTQASKSFLVDVSVPSLSLGFVLQRYPGSVCVGSPMDMASSDERRLSARVRAPSISSMRVYDHLADDHMEKRWDMLSEGVLSLVQRMLKEKHGYDLVVVRESFWKVLEECAREVSAVEVLSTAIGRFLSSLDQRRKSGLANLVAIDDSSAAQAVGVVVWDDRVAEEVVEITKKRL